MLDPYSNLGKILDSQSSILTPQPASVDPRRVIFNRRLTHFPEYSLGLYVFAPEFILKVVLVYLQPLLN